MYYRDTSGRTVPPHEKPHTPSGGGTPLLIPQDYHGEFLRGETRTRPKEEGPAPMFSAELHPSHPVREVRAAEVPAPAQSEVHVNMPEAESHTSLLDGLRDLLVGKSSSEEETLLLLAVALLLLWGQADRGLSF